MRPIVLHFFAKTTQISDFLALPNCHKVGKFGAFIKHPRAKTFVFQLQGGLLSDSLL